jgi:hypothetical protein
MEATIVIMVLFIGNKNVSLRARSNCCGEAKNNKNMYVHARVTNEWDVIMRNRS